MDWKWLLFSFEGRANRAKWWLVVLIFIVISVVLWLVILPMLGFSMLSTPPTTMSLISLVVVLIFAYPGTAAMVKRLNDRDRPAWLAAVFWLPTILGILAPLLGIGVATMEIEGQSLPVPTTTGWVINLVSFAIAIWGFVELGCLRGTRGPNRHGPDPLTGPGHA